MGERKDVLWLNGNLVAAEEARISPFDHGFTVGDGIFETLVAARGVPFAFDEHCARLEKGAAVMGLESPGQEALARAIQGVMDASGRTDDPTARIRITITGGPAPPGSGRGDQGQTVVVTVTDLPEMPPSTKVITVPYIRNERGAVAGIKSTSYAENVVALADAVKAGATEALFANTRDLLCEGTGSNVFLVDRDGILVTPSLASGCLAGVTRALVLEVCEEQGIPCDARDVSMEELEEAVEVFLTSSTRRVQAVAELDGRNLSGAMGEWTRTLRAGLVRLEEASLNARASDPRDDVDLGRMKPE